MHVINNDLIRQIYELNGWDTSRMCKIDYENLSEVDLESYSKAVQRMLSTSGIPVNLDVVNRNLDMLGVDRLPEDMTMEELKEIMPDYTSKSGKGFSAPNAPIIAMKLIKTVPKNLMVGHIILWF